MRFTLILFSSLIICSVFCDNPTMSDCTTQYICTTTDSYCTKTYGLPKHPAYNICQNPAGSQCEDTPYLCDKPEFPCIKDIGYIRSEQGLCVQPSHDDCVAPGNVLCGYALLCYDLGGYKVVNGDATCYAPTDEECQDTNQSYCSLNSYYCSAILGYMNKQSRTYYCEAPTEQDCLNETYLCRDPRNICVKTYGFVKTDKDGKCGLPTPDQCLDDANTLCKLETQQCIKSLKLFKKNDTGACRLPNLDECQQANKAFCSFVTMHCVASFGLVKSNPAGDCRVPTTDECTNGSSTLCSDTNMYCVTNLGYTKSTQAGLCAVPDDLKCVEVDANLCKINTQYCVASLGYLKNSNNDCVAPTEDQCRQPNTTLCKDPKFYCNKSYGFIKNNDAGLCSLPQDSDCLQNNSALCNDDTKYYCVKTLGFTKGAAGICVAPADCKAASQGFCSDKMTYCIGKGYQKGNNNDCVCDSAKYTEENNKCTLKSEPNNNNNPTPQTTTNALLIKSSLIILLINYFM